MAIFEETDCRSLRYNEDWKRRAAALSLTSSDEDAVDVIGDYVTYECEAFGAVDTAAVGGDDNSIVPDYALVAYLVLADDCSTLESLEVSPRVAVLHRQRIVDVGCQLPGSDLAYVARVRDAGKLEELWDPIAKENREPSLATDLDVLSDGFRACDTAERWSRDTIGGKPQPVLLDGARIDSRDDIWRRVQAGRLLCGEEVASLIEEAIGPEGAGVVFISGGQHVVGEDIAPGLYTGESVENCYWERLRGYSGSASDIIDNGFVAFGRVEILVSSSDLALNLDGCGFLRLQP